MIGWRQAGSPNGTQIRLHTVIGHRTLPGGARSAHGQKEEDLLHGPEKVPSQSGTKKVAVVEEPAAGSNPISGC